MYLAAPSIYPSLYCRKPQIMHWFGLDTRQKETNFKPFMAKEKLYYLVSNQSVEPLMVQFMAKHSCKWSITVDEH